MAVYFFVKGADEIEEIETLIEAVETRLYNIKKEKISDDNVYQSFLMIRNYMNLIGTMKVPLREYWLMNFETRDKEVELAKKLVGFSQIDDTNHLEYGIYLAGKLIGFINDCGFENNEIEIGYVVHPDYQGQGYATESVKAVIEDIRDMGFKKVMQRISFHEHGT